MAAAAVKDRAAEPAGDLNASGCHGQEVMAVEWVFCTRRSRGAWNARRRRQDDGEECRMRSFHGEISRPRQNAAGAADLMVAVISYNF